MTVRDRADFIKGGISVGLPLPEFCQTWEQCMQWKNLPDHEFMQKYGNAVVAGYKMPTAQELEQLRLWNEKGGDDDDDDNDNDDEDEPEEGEVTE